MNVKNHHIYSDNFTLGVVNLSRIDLATEEDKKYGIDYWAKLFKASTWEEIAEKDASIEKIYTEAERLRALLRKHGIQETE